MAVELNISPREVWFAKQLARRPELYWEEMMTYEEKLMMYNSGLELDTIPDDMMDEFEYRMAIKGDAGLQMQLEVALSETIGKITP